MIRIPTQGSTNSPSCAIMASLHAFRLTGDVPTDCVLVCAEDREVPCHSLVLSAISPVLRAAFRPDRFSEGASRRYALADFPASVVESALAWACGAGGLDADDATALLELADLLEFGPLRSESAALLRSKLTSQNAAAVLECADRFNCQELANEAREVIADPTTGGVLSGLRKRRCILTAEVATLKVELRDRQTSLHKKKEAIGEISDRMVYETNLAFREAEVAAEAAVSTDATGLSSGYSDPPLSSHPYLYKGRRRLVVRSLDTLESGEPSKGSAGSSGIPILHCRNLKDAFNKAQAGDVIELPPGYYSDMGRFDVCVAVRGIGDRSKIVLGAYRSFKSNAEDIDLDKPVCINSPDGLLNVMKGADVMFSNLTIDGNGVGSGLLTVEEKSRVWLDRCVLNLTECSVRVQRDASAFVSDCTFQGKVTVDRVCFGIQESKGCVGNAIQIDPQADKVVVSGCKIKGTGVGSARSRFPRDRPYLPGQAGAIEIRAIKKPPLNLFSVRIDERDQRPSLEATVQLEVKNTTIMGCHGQALTYRKKFKCSAGMCTGRRYNSFETEVSEINCTLVGSTIEHNALALDGETTAKGLVENTHSNFDDCPESVINFVC